MTKYKQITISKISDHGGTEKTPTHKIVVRDEKGNKAIVGKLWTKTSDHGKFLSGLMNNEYKDPAGRIFDGYVIISETELNELLVLKQTVEEVETMDALFPTPELTSAGTKVPDFTEVDENTEDTPF